MKKIIYVTGCLGFIGSSLTKKLLNLGHYVVGVDKQTYAANINFLNELKKYKNFKYEQIDIADMDSLIECDIIINTAAETHVDNSIIGTNKFLKSNVIGVENLLNLILTKRHFKLPLFLQFEY
jgi:dTDP-glucose 4,6-dehydratase